MLAADAVSGGSAAAPLAAAPARRGLGDARGESRDRAVGHAAHAPGGRVVAWLGVLLDLAHDRGGDVVGK